MMAQSEASTLQLDTFDEIAEIVRDETGLQLASEKRLMVQSRLRPRVRSLRLNGFDEYVALLKTESGRDEMRHMISALTTNVSHFFREAHHFDFLAERCVPMLRRKITSGDRVRIWSAGCSNGQEPYSIGMHLVDLVPELASADFRILATDIDPKVISFARRGIYAEKDVGVISEKLLNTFFERTGTSGEYRVVDRLRSMIVFNELNLMRSWPMKGKFDAIFCRNVVIYFDGATQEALWPRFADMLAPNGFLFLGHSERIANVDEVGLVTVGPTTYAHAASHRKNRNI